MESGHIYGLKGRNGSGKTMLMRCLCGLIYPSSGSVKIDGKVLGRDLPIPPSIGALIEAPAFLPEYGHLLVAAFDMPEDPEALAEEIMQSGYYVPHYYAIDIRTGEVKELPYLYYQTALEDAFTYQEGKVCFIAAETEDQYLCCKQMNTIVVDFPRNDGTVVELPYNTPLYAMISKDTFWHGSGTLVPVEIIS